MRKLLFIPLLLCACTTTQLASPKGAFKPNCPNPNTPNIVPGTTELLLDVNAAGEAENIRITKHSPNNIWDDYAICMAKSQKYTKNAVGQVPPFKDHTFVLEMKEVP